MTKKILSLILAILMMVSLFGCAKKNEDIEVTTEATEVTEIVDETTETEAPTEEVTEPTVEETEHIHDWTDKVKKANCTDSGYTERTCSTCGEITRGSFTNPTGHYWGEWKTIKEPTTTATGTAERACSACKVKETRELAKVIEGHTHKYTSKVTQEATCAKAGVKTYTCSCGDSYTEDIVKLAHKYTDKTVAATCKLRGYIEHTCSVCGNSYRDNYTDVLKHDYKETVTKPTCTEGGYTTKKCKNCGESVVENKTVATGHSWSDWKVTKEATEKEAGVKERTCGNCKEKETEAIAKLNHTHKYTDTVTKPTCTAEGYTTHKCECGDSYVDSKVSAAGHKWSDWKVTKEATETVNGTKERTCSVCKVKETDAIPKLNHTHKYTDTVTKPTCTAEGYTTHKCSCGDSYVDTKVAATGHSWGEWKVVKEATTTSAGSKERTCSTCKAKDTATIPKVTHSHSYTSVVTKPTCTEDGYTTYTCTCGDSYVGNKVASTGHSYTHTVTKPTCTAEGYTTHKCSKCKDSYTDTKVSATGHSWSEWVTVIAPTENSTGLARRTCNGCGDAATKTLDMVGHTHNYKTTVDYKAPSCSAEGYETKACSCGDTNTTTLPMEHNWVSKHTDEVGHYEGKIVCHCGNWSASVNSDYVAGFAAHINSVDPEDKYNHSYYESVKWVVDTPAQHWQECSACGTKK